MRGKSVIGAVMNRGRLTGAAFAALFSGLSLVSGVSAQELLVTDDGAKGIHALGSERNRWRPRGIEANKAFKPSWYSSLEELDFFTLEYGHPCEAMEFDVPERKNGVWSRTWGYSRNSAEPGIRFGRGWERYRTCRWAIEMEVEQEADETDWRLYLNRTIDERKSYDFKVRGRGRQTFEKNMDLIRLLVRNSQISGLELACLTPGAKGRIHALRLVPRVAFVTWKRAFDLDETPVRAGLSMTGYSDYKLAVNGRKIGQGVISVSTGTDRYELGDFLKVGANELTIRAEIGGGWSPGARLEAELFVVNRDGRTIRFDADEKWLWSRDGETWRPAKAVKREIREVPLHAGALDPRPVETNGYPVFDFDGEIAWRFRLPGAITNPRLSWRVEDALKGGIVEEGETTDGLTAKDGAATVEKIVRLTTCRTGAYRVWWKLLSDNKVLDEHDTEMVVAGPLDQTVVPLKDFEKTLSKRMKKVQEVDCTKDETDPTRFLDHSSIHAKPTLNVGKVAETGGIVARQTGTRDLDYFAYKLEVGRLGAPHILEVDYPETHEYTLYCWINESYPVSFCNNMPPEGSRSWPNATGSVKVGGYLPLSGGVKTMRIVFFPGSRNITASFENGGVAGPAAVCGFRVYEVRDGLPALDVPKDTRRRYMNHNERQLFAAWGAYVNPVIRYEQCGLVEDGWIAAYAAAANRTAFLRYAGHNAADEGVYMYESGFPTKSGESNTATPEFDFRYPMLKLYRHNGIHTVLTFEYLRSPILERLGLLSVSDREIQAGTKRSIYAITRDGRQAVGYMGQGMNFMNREVRASMRRLLGEIHDRYAPVADVEDFLVVCGSWWMPGMTRFPGYGYDEIGFDDDSVEAFERETGIRVDDGGRSRGAERFTRRFKALNGPYRKSWYDWRAAKMREALEEMRGVVSCGARPWELIILANESLDKGLPEATGYREADFGEGTGNPVRMLARMCFGRECDLDSYGSMFNAASAENLWRQDCVMFSCGKLNEHWSVATAAPKWWWRSNGVCVYDVKPSGSCAFWDTVTMCADYAPRTIVHSWLDVNCTTAHAEESRRFLDAYYRLPLDRHPQPIASVSGVTARRYGDKALLVNPTPWAVEGVCGGEKIELGPYGMSVRDAASVQGEFRMAEGCPHADFGAAVRAMSYDSIVAVRNAEELKRNLVGQRRLERQLERDGVARIDVGSRYDTTDEKGRRWLCEQRWVPGRAYGSEGVVSINRGKVEIGGTKIPSVYRTEAGAKDFHRYHFPVPKGRYDVVLHYAETWDRLPGQRLMEVKVNGQARKVDVWKLAGGRMRACQVTFEGVDVPEDGEILYESGPRAILNAIEIKRK